MSVQVCSGVFLIERDPEPTALAQSGGAGSGRATLSIALTVPLCPSGSINTTLIRALTSHLRPKCNFQKDVRQIEYLNPLVRRPCHCIGRESNPGLPRGRREFYH